ncbi:MAG: YtxH domain-containing protein [Rubrobacteraceae bacterium]
MEHRRLRTFLIGGAVGALAGILLAPRSGRELRGSIANRAGEARERSRESYFQAQERMRERLASAREGSSRTHDLENEPFAGPANAAVAPEEEPETAAPRPPLRDVSWDARQDARRKTADKEIAAEPGETPSDLRRRVRETRDRLRARLDEGRDDDDREE